MLWGLLTSRLLWLALAATQADAKSGASRAGKSTADLEYGQMVDLGYAKYNGTLDHTTNLRAWQGIRYAGIPTGPLRWQAPAPPPQLSEVQTAFTSGPACMQQLPAGGGTSSQKDTSEDCLFLNVYAPTNKKKKLPVMVWFHGGGFGSGGIAQYDPTALEKATDNGFVFVSVAYRLGIMGFLAGKDIKDHGAANAGLLDQVAALKWVQKYIKLFGGDPNRVTITGQSAGAGAVLLHSVAYGSTLKNSLFQGLIAASPAPGMPLLKSFVGADAEAQYTQVVEQVGCANQTDRFSCLQLAPYTALVNASAVVTNGQATFGTWAFQPVIDGTYLIGQPATLLSTGRVNGARALITSNAEEGSAFTPSNITSRNHSSTWMNAAFGPLPINITQVSDLYAFDPKVQTNYATNGVSHPDANSVSSTAYGEQAQANNLMAEATIVCPAYWMAQAFEQSWKLQYSVTPSLHTTDLSLIFPEIANQPYHGSELQSSTMSLWGNFILGQNPGAQNDLACKLTQSAIPEDSGPAYNSSNVALCHWPTFNSRVEANMLNVNQTGGHLRVSRFKPHSLTPFYVNPGLTNDFTLVNGTTWEGGRGRRCRYWMEQAMISAKGI